MAAPPDVSNWYLINERGHTIAERYGGVKGISVWVVTLAIPPAFAFAFPYVVIPDSRPISFFTLTTIVTSLAFSVARSTRVLCIGTVVSLSLNVYMVAIFPCSFGFVFLSPFFLVHHLHSSPSPTFLFHGRNLPLPKEHTQLLP